MDNTMILMCWSVEMFLTQMPPPWTWWPQPLRAQLHTTYVFNKKLLYFLQSEWKLDSYQWWLLRIFELPLKTACPTRMVATLPYILTMMKREHHGIDGAGKTLMSLDCLSAWERGVDLPIHKHLDALVARQPNGTTHTSFIIHSLVCCYVSFGWQPVHGTKSNFIVLHPH